MGRKTHRIRAVVLTVVGVLVLLSAGMMGFALLGRQPTYDLTLAGVSAQGLADGTYTGAYAAFRFSNTVAVTVKDQTIRDIQVVKPQVVAKAETADALRGEVLAAQSTTVDTVAGATIDSKAYLKAVENALTGAR
jgi:uncharacterized protein with FMN-binding domain